MCGGYDYVKASKGSSSGFKCAIAASSMNERTLCWGLNELFFNLKLNNFLFNKNLVLDS
jgi:hypothetical protein